MTWLTPMLARIGTTHTPRPDNVNVVDIPGGLDKLRRAIEQVIKEGQQAREQRADYEHAWAAATKEYDAAMAKNEAWQRNLETRLYRLRSEWANVTHQLGIGVTLEPPPGVSFDHEDQS